MLSGFKQQGIVGKDGRLEIIAPDLKEGTPVEVIVLVESSEPDETEYLLSSPANRSHLLAAIAEVEQAQSLVILSPDEWHEKYSLSP